MTARVALFAAGAAALLILAWFFAPRGEDETALRIERRARLDLVDACNQAAAASGKAVRFGPQDIAAVGLGTVGQEGAVSALVSIFEARRGGLVCKWNGVDPATVAFAD